MGGACEERQGKHMNGLDTDTDATWRAVEDLILKSARRLFCIMISSTQESGISNVEDLQLNKNQLRISPSRGYGYLWLLEGGVHTYDVALTIWAPQNLL